jgi:hypothetical protein
MKHTKKLLSLLLVFVLAFALAIPAAYAQEGESLFVWDEFYIITQPQGKTVPHGESFTLSVEVSVPAGATVTYQWYLFNGSLIEDAATSTLQLGSSDPGYPQMPKATSGNVGYYRAEHYYCIINAYEKDTEGTIIDSATLNSDYAAVKVENTFWEKLYSVTLEPFVFSIMGTFGAFIWVGPLALTGTLYFLIERYITNFRELFS